MATTAGAGAGSTAAAENAETTSCDAKRRQETDTILIENELFCC